ncbi:annexin B9-like [Photinus pyralis]|nr:annexin B9-like [Photinus pyralis]XP_031351120.1 annexin B9-like [Photinus pyralis]
MGPSWLFYLAYIIADGLSSEPQQNDLKSDAEFIKHALPIGNTSGIADILSHRLYDQRLEIAHQFQLKYGKFLKEELASHAGDEMKHLLFALVVPTPVFYATELHNAIMGIGTNENVIIEILCTLTNSEMWAVIDAYEAEFQHKLIDDIKGDTSGDFKHLLVAILQANRDDSGATNKAQAAADALHLHKAGLDKIGTDEKVFYDILGTRNHNQLKLICDEYKHLSGHDLEYAIEKEFSGHAKDGLLAIVATARNLPAYFAEQLHHCMTAGERKNEQLVRILVPRVKVVDTIMQEYSKAYGRDLKTDISEHTKGVFKESILRHIH